MYREGQSRGRPKRAEHGRTVVRIATPASVLQPRPRSTVHDFRALPVLFFPRSSQRNKKRREARTISVFQEETRATCAASESDRSTAFARGSWREKSTVAFPVAAFSRHFSSPVKWPRLRYHPFHGIRRSNLLCSEPERTNRGSELQGKTTRTGERLRATIYHETHRPRCVDRCSGGGCRFDGKPVGFFENFTSHSAFPGARGTRSWNWECRTSSWSVNASDSRWWCGEKKCNDSGKRSPTVDGADHRDVLRELGRMGENKIYDKECSFEVQYHE